MTYLENGSQEIKKFLLRGDRTNEFSSVAFV